MQSWRSLRNWMWRKYFENLIDFILGTYIGALGQKQARKLMSQLTSGGMGTGTWCRGFWVPFSSCFTKYLPNLMIFQSGVLEYIEGIEGAAEIIKYGQNLAKMKKSLVQLTLTHLFSLFRNKRFALNEMFQRNASKFAIFYV